MTTLIWSYIGLYVLVSIVLVVAEAVSEEKEPLWETVVDYALLAIGLVGMLLFQRNVEWSSLKFAWMALAPMLVVAHVILNLAGRRRALVEETGFTRTAVHQTDLGAILFLAPSLAINFGYAYG